MLHKDNDNEFVWSSELFSFAILLLEHPVICIYLVVMFVSFTFQVVVKFIRKGKVFNDCWVQDQELGRMPLEVSLLRKLEHPNIVKVSGAQ